MQDRTHQGRGLPPPVADFADRDTDVETIVAHLRHETCPIAGIWGMPGVGKTQIALKVARSLLEQYPEQRIFNLQPSKPLTPHAALGQVIHALEPGQKLPDTLEELQDLYRRLLAGRRGLLLLDNAVDVEQVQGLLPPPEGWGAIVTARVFLSIDGGRLHDVDVFSLAYATELLAKILSNGERHDLVDADLRPLAELCGRLPLALRLAGSYLCAAKGRTLDSYIKRLDKERLKYLASADGQQSVRAVLSLSVARLSEKSPVLARQWRDLAVFAAPFDLPAVVSVWAVEENKAEDLLDTLRTQYLVQLEVRKYSLHSLLRELALEEPPSDAIRCRHAFHYLALGKKANEHYHKQEGALVGLEQFDAVLPHLLSAYRWMCVQNSAEALEWLTRFPDETADVLDLRMSATDKQPILEAAVKAARQQGDRLREGAHLGNLGLLHFTLDDVKQAMKLAEEALVISQEVNDRRREAAHLWLLGQTYTRLGQAERAIEYEKQALAISRQLGVNDRRGEGAYLGSLGAAYLADGQTETGITRLEEALAVARETGDRAGQATRLGNLASAYADTRQAQRAVEYAKEALEISRQMKDRRTEGNQEGILARAYLEVESVREAIVHYQAALAISRETKNRRMEGALLGNLARAWAKLPETTQPYDCYKRADDCYKQAVDFCEQALAISNEIDDQRERAVNLAGLGAVYAKLRERTRAIEYYKHAVEASQGIHDQDAEGRYLNNLGEQYKLDGRLDVAADCLDKARNIARDRGDREHELSRAWALGEVYEALGCYQDAVKEMAPRVEWERETGKEGLEHHAAHLQEVREKEARREEHVDPRSARSYLPKLDDVAAQEKSRFTVGTVQQRFPASRVVNTGRAWGVLVGVNHYENQPRIPSLRVCVNDVTAVHACLASSFTATRLLTDDTPECLPTRANILSELNSVAQAADEGDLLLFYFSGHGMAEAGESYLLPRDARVTALKLTAVGMNDVREIIESSFARAKVVILDACHSGAAIDKAGAVMTAEFIRRVFEEAEGMAVLASCKQSQKSWEWPSQKQSVFTHFLLEALGGNADVDGKGFVTVLDAHRYVTHGVKMWAVENRVLQTPTLHGEVAGDIVLLKLSHICPEGA